VHDLLAVATFNRPTGLFLKASWSIEIARSFVYEICGLYTPTDSSEKPLNDFARQLAEGSRLKSCLVLS
jgi:hypothetical protein